MTRDIKEKLPVPSSMGELVFRWAAQRDAAKDKGASVKSQVLLTLFSLLAHQVNGFELLETPLGDPNGR